MPWLTCPLWNEWAHLLFSPWMNALAKPCCFRALIWRQSRAGFYSRYLSLGWSLCLICLGLDRVLVLRPLKPSDSWPTWSWAGTYSCPIICTWVCVGRALAKRCCEDLVYWQRFVGLCSSTLNRLLGLCPQILAILRIQHQTQLISSC